MAQPAAQPFTVRVPATVANLGAGFDCFGIALDLHLEVDVEPGPQFDVRFRGEGAAQLAAEAPGVLGEAIELGARELQGPTTARLMVRNPIPIASGLGSSAAAIVAGLRIAEGLAGRRLPPDRILTLADRLEGHPDNVAAALFGGLVIAYRAGGTLRWARCVPSAGVVPVVAVPRRQMRTRESRAVVPGQVPLPEAVQTAARAGLVVAGLLRGDAALLVDGFDDRLHQPERLRILPETAAVYDALRARGYAVALAGAGPSLLIALDTPTAGAGMASIRAVVELAAGDWQVQLLGWDSSGAQDASAAGELEEETGV